MGAGDGPPPHGTASRTPLATPGKCACAGDLSVAAHVPCRSRRGPGRLLMTSTSAWAGAESFSVHRNAYINAHINAPHITENLLS